MMVYRTLVSMMLLSRIKLGRVIPHGVLSPCLLTLNAVTPIKLDHTKKSMKTSKTKTISALLVAVLFGLAGVSPVSAFLIDFPTSFVPIENIPHVGQPIHEGITRDAITNVTPAASLAFITNMQRGVENSDIIHQFDGESHFDNSSVALNVGFSNGFATMTQRFAAARPKSHCVGNQPDLAMVSACDWYEKNLEFHRFWSHLKKD